MVHRTVRLARRGLFGLAIAGAACGSPTAPARATFTGHWVGTYIVRQCVPTGWPSCNGLAGQVETIHSIDLTLTQVGTSASGALNVTDSPTLTMPVTGTVSQMTLSIGGTVTDPVLNRVSTDVIRIVAWTTTIDSSGRMQGTLRFRRETLWGPANMGHPVGEIWIQDVSAELANVGRLP